MSDTVNIKVQRGITDLDTFTEITLAKLVPFTPVATTAEALARLGNDNEKFLELLNEGLRAETRRIAAGDPSDWHTLDDDGEVNGPFTGTIADPKSVNALVLTLAKTVFGYQSIPDSATKEFRESQKAANNAAKVAAMEMIKTTPSIKEGLKKSAALKPEESGSTTA